MNQEAPRREELDYVIVRQYRPEDRPKLISLLRENWPDYDPGVYRAKEYLIAENNGRIVGAVFCRMIHNDMHLFDLAVSECFRRQGVAAELIQAAEDRAVEIGMENLRITASGLRLVAYYRNLGFVQTLPPAGKIMVKPIESSSPQI